MAFVGFDLDETLGRFAVPDGHLYFLMPEALYTTQFRPYAPFHIPSEELKRKLQAAFDTFAVCLADKEPELGMLRPGILEIVKKIAQLKEEGRVKGIVVYSNNGNLAALLLATKMIEHKLEKPGLFCNHIDWWNPIRNGKNQKGKPGKAKKTARVLQESFVGRCGDIESYEDVPLEKLFFFDDLNPPHPDLYRHIGADRYFKVNPYKKDASLEEVQSCFDQALQSEGLLQDQEYLTYITKILRSAQPPFPRAFASINQYLQYYNDGFVLKDEPFLNDTEEILRRLDALFPPRAASAEEEGGNADIAPGSPVPNNFGGKFYPIGGKQKIKNRHRSVNKNRKNQKNTHKRANKRTRKN